MYQATVRNSLAWDPTGSMRSDWNFDTIRSSQSAMGTFRSMARDLTSLEISEEGEEVLHGSIDTGGATKGSDPLHGDGASSVGSHTTMIVKPAESPSSDKDMATLLEGAEGQASSAGGDVPPPAYTGSMRGTGSRRSSYAARHAAAGTVMKEGDVGNGVDTIRPIKKLDAAGSLRLSAEYVGSMRREGSSSAPSSPTSHKRAPSELGKAGVAIVDDVVQPILQKVSSAAS